MLCIEEKKIYKTMHGMKFFSNQYCEDGDRLWQKVEQPWIKHFSKSKKTK